MPPVVGGFRIYWEHTLEPHPCRGCTAMIVPGPTDRRRRLFCERRCAKYFRATGRRLEHPCPPLGHPPRECAGCTYVIQPGPRERNVRRWCCESCRVTFARVGQRLTHPHPRAGFVVTTYACGHPHDGLGRSSTALCLPCVMDRQAAKRDLLRVCVECEAPLTWPRRGFCSDRCQYRTFNHRRRARQANAPGRFTWAEFMGVFLAFDRCCAYCEQPIQGQPQPDHVVPLSRGGSNSITNILPACGSCNPAKGDRSLAEWATARVRAGLPPRTTSWALADPRVQHLTVLVAA